MSNVLLLMQFQYIFLLHQVNFTKEKNKEIRRNQIETFHNFFLFFHDVWYSFGDVRLIQIRIEKSYFRNKTFPIKITVYPRLELETYA